MKKTAVALAGTVALAGIVAIPAAAAQPKVSLCHADEEGGWSLISVAQPAERAHLKHGDVRPGTEGLDESCQITVTPPTVTEGPAAMTKAGEVRFKGQNGGGEVYVGLMTDQSAMPRKEANYDGIKATGTHPVTVSYDPATGMLTGAVDAVTVQWDFADGQTSCAPGDADVMNILVRDGRTTAGVAFSDVRLADFDLGSFGAVDVPGTSYSEWAVSGFGFGEGFTLTGNLDVDNFVGNEAMKLDITFGCSA